MAPFPIRALFYLLEAGVLSALILAGLWMARGGAPRLRRRVPSATWPRATALFAIMAVADWAVTEHAGPQYLSLHFLAGLVFAAGVFTWLLARIAGHRADSHR